MNNEHWEALQAVLQVADQLEEEDLPDLADTVANVGDEMIDRLGLDAEQAAILAS